jgi:hypothetical protein
LQRGLNILWRARARVEKFGDVHALHRRMEIGPARDWFVVVEARPQGLHFHAAPCQTAYRLAPRSQANPEKAISERSDFRQLFFQQLLVIQVGVVAVQGEKLVVRAELNDGAAMQDCDPVGVAHGGNTV